MFSDQSGMCYENNVSGTVTFIFFLIFKNVKERGERSLIKQKGNALNN